MKSTGKRSQNSAKSSVVKVVFFSLNACGVGEKQKKQAFMVPAIFWSKCRILAHKGLNLAQIGKNGVKIARWGKCRGKQEK